MHTWWQPVCLKGYFVGEICKVLRGKSEGKTMYLFSDDLFWGCLFFSHIAKESKNQFEIIAYNTSCVLYAGSFIEAKINELIARVAGSEGDGVEPSIAFWEALEENQKQFTFKEKWNLIASIKDGEKWDGSSEPFQSYDLISTLRNELVHFKGALLENDEVPVKKLKALAQRFKGESNIAFEAMEASCWVHNILTSAEVGEWISKTVKDFDLNFDSFLSGKELSEEERNMKLMRRQFHCPY